MMLEWDPMIRSFYTGVMNIAYKFSCTLGTWELAQAAQLDKRNGKEGPLGIRLIMMLDPLGKVYYWLLHGLTTDVKRPFGYGFYANRRREQAILVHHATTGRLIKAASTASRDDKQHYSHVTTYRDISNAFPSVSHGEMRQTLEATVDPWTSKQLRARHCLLYTSPSPRD